MLSGVPKDDGEVRSLPKSVSRLDKKIVFRPWSN